MWSILITLTVLGVTTEYHLPAYYEHGRDCQQTADRMIARYETREGVGASIQCVKGWNIAFKGGTNAH